MTRKLFIRSQDGDDMHITDFCRMWDGSFYWLPDSNAEGMYLAISRREKLWNLYPKYVEPCYVVYCEMEK